MFFKTQNIKLNKWLSGGACIPSPALCGETPAMYFYYSWYKIIKFASLQTPPASVWRLLSISNNIFWKAEILSFCRQAPRFFFLCVLQKPSEGYKVCCASAGGWDCTYYFSLSLRALRTDNKSFLQTTPTTQRGESSEREKSLSDLSMAEKTAGEEKYRQGHRRERRAVEPERRWAL